MKVYFIRHIPNRLENNFFTISPRRLLLSEVAPVLGGVVVANNAVVYSTNKGSFASIKQTNRKLKSEPIYILDLGAEKLEIVIIPDGVNTYLIDLKTWQRHKEKCLDLIESKGMSDEFILPTRNSIKILQLIRKDITNYLLGKE